MPKHYRQLRVKDLPKVPTWWLELDSNLQPSAHKTLNLPLCHHTSGLSFLNDKNDSKNNKNRKLVIIFIIMIIAASEHLRPLDASLIPGVKIIIIIFFLYSEE